jgi:hypothetical protein
MPWYERLYCWFWYRCQWFVKNKYLRRPFTLWMRDFMNKHRIAGIASICLAVALLDWLVWFNPYFVLLSNLLLLIIGHVCWGREWIPNEQESPTYIETDMYWYN